MKICVAQTQSIKGEVSKNITNHIQIIKTAITWKADLIVFPELSITGYEPDLVKALATDLESELFNPFQELSDEHLITIGVGMPLHASDGINISMFIFQPKLPRMAYTKNLLHEDEFPFFVSGKAQPIFTIKNRKIAFGICYESLQRTHFLQAKQKGADLYVASVAKAKAGIEKGFSYYSTIAKEFNTPIFLSNCVGHCDDFLSVGNSAVWNEKGELMEKLDNQNQGILSYDLDTQTTKKEYLAASFSEEV